LDKKNSPRQIVMMIDPRIPHPMAGKWVEVVGGVYGLKQSNHIFGEDFSHTILSAGFAHTTDPAIFVKIDSADPSKKCVVSTHVDDGLSIHTHQPFHNHLMQVLTARYGPLTIDPEASSYVGTTLVRHPNGAFTTDMKGGRFMTSGWMISLERSLPHSRTFFLTPSTVLRQTRPYTERILALESTSSRRVMMCARKSLTLAPKLKALPSTTCANLST
jgi:hypothetical protein